MLKKITVTLLSAMTLAGCIGERTNGDAVKVGDPVPAFTVTKPFGDGMKAFSQADFAGKRSIIIFFATWCPDCRRELPIIYEAWQRLVERPDFQFVAISREETSEAVSEYWNSVLLDEESGAVIKPSFEPMPWWLDPDASAFHTFADSYIPRIYLVDTRGEIASVAVETFELTADKIVELIEGLK